MKLKSKGIVFLVALIFTACAYAPAGIAPSTTPLNPDNITVLGHATGEFSYFSLFGVIPFDKLDYQAAIDDAVNKYDGGRALINVTSTFETTWVVIGVIFKVKVEGDVVK